MLEIREPGLYCGAGDFYIDPVSTVDRAVITHAHNSHAIPGCRQYFTPREGEALLRLRVGAEASVQTAEYGESITVGGVAVSLHPAGHILGSSQVRLERGGEIWVISGDYKVAADPTCAPFEAIRCHTYVTESTFALPIFRWTDARETVSSIEAWWRENQQTGKASLLFAHPTGKAQRILASIDQAIGPIVCHEAVERINAIYRERGINLPHINDSAAYQRPLVVAPVSAVGSQWARKFAPASTALASGWMRIRGPRRRRALDRGFVLSDHADWDGLLQAIGETGAETVWVMHGFREPLSRWLNEHGKEALAIALPSPEADAE